MSRHQASDPNRDKQRILSPHRVKLKASNSSSPYLVSNGRFSHAANSFRTLACQEQDQEGTAKKAKAQAKLQKRLAQGKVEVNDPVAKKVRCF
jgi:hypothetical protein